MSLIGFSSPRPGVAEWLTGVAGADQFDRLERRPVDDGQIAQVGHAGPVPLMDAGRFGGVFGVPRQPAAEYLFDGEVEAADPTAQ